MAIPTVYRWDDKNAPVITNIHDWTQVYDWFQAIFVDGYLEDDDVTAKPGMGWDLVIDSRAAPTTYEVSLTQAEKPGVLLAEQNKMLIELNYVEQCTGNRFGPRFIGCWEDGDKTNLLYASAAADIYGTGPWFGQNDDDLKICPWIIVGTDRGFWAFAGHNHNVPAGTKPTEFTSITNYCAFRYLGDFVNDGVNLDKNNQTCNSHMTTTQFNVVTSISAQPSYYYLGSSFPMKTGRNYLNEIESGELPHKEFIMYGHLYPGNWTTGIKYPYLDGGLYIKPWELWHKAGKVYYGKLPGAYYPMHDTPLYHSLNFVEFTGTGIYEGDKFIGLSYSGYCEFYINLSQDWGIGTT